MRKPYHEQGKVKCNVTSPQLITPIPVPGCAFCRPEVRAQAIAHYPPGVPIEQATAYLLIPTVRPNGDDYLVIPVGHAESEFDLPDDFTAACKHLAMLIPWMPEAMADPKNPAATSCRDGMNHGASSGKTVWHEHKWYIRTPAGFRVPGAATMAHNELMCQTRFGLTVNELIAVTISNRDKPSEDEEPARDEDPWL